MKFTVQRHRLTKRLRLNHQTIDKPRQPIFLLDDYLDSQIAIDMDLLKVSDITYVANSLAKQGYRLRKQPKMVPIIKVREEVQL